VDKRVKGGRGRFCDFVGLLLLEAEDEIGCHGEASDPEGNVR
jgi:hypothetical protein